MELHSFDIETKVCTKCGVTFSGVAEGFSRAECFGRDTMAPRARIAFVTRGGETAMYINGLLAGVGLDQTGTSELLIGFEVDEVCRLTINDGSYYSHSQWPLRYMELPR